VIDRRDQRSGRVRGRRCSCCYERRQRFDQALASLARASLGNRCGNLGKRGHSEAHEQGLACFTRNSVRHVRYQAVAACGPSSSVSTSMSAIDIAPLSR